MPFYLSFSLLWRSATFETFPLFLVDIFLFFHRLFSFYLTVRVSICSISSSNTFIVEVISSMKGNVITKVVPLNCGSKCLLVLHNLRIILWICRLYLIFLSSTFSFIFNNQILYTILVIIIPYRMRGLLLLDTIILFRIEER